MADSLHAEALNIEQFYVINRIPKLHAGRFLSQSQLIMLQLLMNCSTKKMINFFPGLFSQVSVCHGAGIPAACLFSYLTDFTLRAARYCWRNSSLNFPQSFIKKNAAIIFYLLCVSILMSSRISGFITLHGFCYLFCKHTSQEIITNNVGHPRELRGRNDHRVVLFLENQREVLEQ